MPNIVGCHPGVIGPVADNSIVNNMNLFEGFAPPLGVTGPAG